MSSSVKSDHTSTAFDADLSGLRSDIAEMGGLVVKAVTDAVLALAHRDGELARSVVELDVRIDAIRRVIEERSILAIARRQPVAVDLREIVASFRIANELERFGDLAKNIARRAAEVGELGPTRAVRRLEQMASLVRKQLKAVLDSLVNHDADKALAVWAGDEGIDALHTSLFRELLTYMMEDPRCIGYCTHLLLCAKNIERMGDHATNIAEAVQFIVTGQKNLDPRPKSDESSITVVRMRS
jgi:phosphate transport system protein